MKVIIAGSREINDRGVIAEAVGASGFEVTEVVSGDATGVDRAGAAWGRALGLPVRVMPADWDTHGRSAGPIRNEDMARYADALVAVWDGESRGTRDMIRRAERHGLGVYVHEVEA